MVNKIEFVNTSVHHALQPRQVLRMWTSENTLKLIEDLHSLPCLWDVRSAEYKNRSKKVDACDTLATKYGVSAVEVEKKIQALKTQFRREHKKLVDSRRSWSCPRKALWFGYEPLLFLLQGHESRGSCSTNNAQEVSSQSLSGSKLEGTFQTNSPLEREGKTDNTLGFRVPAPRRSKRSGPDNEDGHVQEALKCMKSPSDTDAKRDDYSVYGEHVGNKLRSCGRNSIEIAIAQHHIDEVLFKLTMGAYSRHPYTSTYCTHRASSHSPVTVAVDHQNYASSSNSSPSVHSPSSN